MRDLRRSTDALASGSRSKWRSQHPADPLVILLLVVGFFLGPLKLLGASWFPYLSADGIAVSVLLVVFGERIANRKPLFAASPLSVPLLLVAAFCLLELGNPNAPLFRSVLGLRSWILYLSFFFVGWYTFRSMKQLVRLYAVLLVLGLVTAAYGVYQWHAGPQAFATWSDDYGRYARLMWSSESGGAVFRAFSTFVLPNVFGSNMALLMLLAFGAAVSPTSRAGWRVVCAATFAVMGAGIAASGSRGPVAHLLLAGGVGLTFIPGVWRRLRVGFMAVALAGAAVIVVLFVIGPAVGHRFASIADPGAFFWKWFLPLTNGIRTAWHHPFGMGLGYTAGVPQFIRSPVFEDLPVTNIDSGYGSAAAELGLVGLGLFTYFALKVGIEGFRTWKGLSVGPLRDLLLGPALYAATYPIVSVIVQPQAALPSAIYFWLLIGMLMKAPALQREVDANRLLRSQMHARQ
jgi:hypothetical protein